MRQDLDELLCKDFPNLYRMHNGFDVGDGWYGIIRDLSVKLEELIRREPEPAMYYAEQVKEKFGGLRFYMSCQTDGIRMAIQDAEDRAARTCEKCGQPGKARDGGWIKTMCDGCKT
jgi:hypothetical protein